MVYRLILVVFFVSGAVGLGYQVLWSKFLLDFIGVSAYSYATVLASFMAGLALGSVYLGRLADRVRSPLRFYAILELGVGAYALLYLPLTRLASGMFGSFVHYGSESAGGGVGLWAKVLVSGLLLLPPTFLLGGTFPAMVRFATRRLGLVGRKVSELYALNALGAVAGTLLMAFVVMPLLGMKGSLFLMAFGNAAVAAVSFLLASHPLGKTAGDDVACSETAGDPVAGDPVAGDPVAGDPVAGDPVAGDPVAGDPVAGDPVAGEAMAGAAAATAGLPHGLVRLALLFILIEGALSFAYEIAWTRYFSMVLGSSTYSFAIMLAAFITGISVGSAILSRIERRITRPLAFFGWSQLAVGVLVLLPLPLYTYLPGVFLEYANLFSKDQLAFYLYEAGKLMFCYLLMLPPTILIGMAIPLLIKGLASNLVRLGSDTGRIYAWNTWGAVGGSLAAGLFLLPALGMETMLAVAAIGNLILGIGILHTATRTDAPRRRRALIVAVPTLVVLLGFHVTTRGWDASWFTLMRLTSGEQRTGAPMSLDSIAQDIAGVDVLLLKDDPAANLMVTDRKENGKSVYTLYVNGKPDASSKGDLPTQYLLGHVPALLHPAPKDALVIGLASGITAGSVLEYDVDRVDVLELLRTMPLATRYFSEWNEKPLEDPRCHLIIEDARSYLMYTEQQYDIIISEPSNPWMAGVGALFSSDFYRRVQHALRDDGLYLQWIHAYELSDESLMAVLRSFRTAFPHVYGFQGTNVDLLLVGSRQAINPDWALIESKMQRPGVKRQLDQIDVRDLPSFLLLQRFSPHTVEYLASLTGTMNTDDNHFLEYRAPRDFFQGLSPVLTLGSDERPLASPALFWSQWLATHRAGYEPLAGARMMSNPQIEIPQIAEAFQLAVLYGSSRPIEETARDEWNLFGRLFQDRTPLGRRELIRWFGTLVQRGDSATAMGLINQYGFACMLDIAMSAQAESDWLRAVAELRDEAPDLPTRQFADRLNIDVLLAARRTDEAAQAIAAAIDGPTQLETSWLVRRACRLGNDSVFEQLITALARRQPDESLQRLLQMRAGAPD